MRGQIMSFDLLIAFVIISLCLGIIIHSIDSIQRRHIVKENRAQILADSIIENCSYELENCPDYSFYWSECGEGHGTEPDCTNRQIGRRFVDCEGEIGELKVVVCE